MDSFFKISPVGRTAIVGCLLALSVFTTSIGQEVEHNYLVGPSRTNCDSLRLEGYSFAETLEKIESTTFRFHQKFRYSRLSGVQAGQFYSCDGQNGFLLLTVDKTKAIYRDVPKTIWDNLIQSPDPDLLYRDKIRDEFTGITE